jgi:hypothetical protein
MNKRIIRDDVYVFVEGECTSRLRGRPKIVLDGRNSVGQLTGHLMDGRPVVKFPFEQRKWRYIPTGATKEDIIRIKSCYRSSLLDHRNMCWCHSWKAGYGLCSLTGSIADPQTCGQSKTIVAPTLTQLSLKRKRKNQ